MVGHKSSIRKSSLKLRLRLSADAVRRGSGAIQRHALTLPELRAARRVALYPHVRNEVETGGLFRVLRRRGKTVAYPRVEGARLAFYAVESLKDLRPGYRGIPEPRRDGSRSARRTPPRRGCRKRPGRPTRPLSVRSIDFFFVPGLAFDRRGYRLGYGGGFYDRTLEKRSRTSTACGLCFAEQLRDRLPAGRHDRPVDVLITPKEVIHALR